MFIMKPNDPNVYLPLIDVVETTLEGTGLTDCGYLKLVEIEIGLKVTLNKLYITNFVQHWNECKSKSSKGNIIIYLSQHHTLTVIYYTSH